MGYSHGMANLAPADFIIFQEGSATVGINVNTGRRIFRDTDAHTVIQGCIDLLEDGIGGIVHIKKGLYDITDTIDIYRNHGAAWTPIWLRGSGITNTRLRLAPSTDKTLLSYDVSGAASDGWKRVSDIQLNGNKNLNASGHGILINNSGAGDNYDIDIHNVFIYGCKENGIQALNNWATKIRACCIEANEGIGINLFGGGQSYVSETSILYNESDGVKTAGYNTMMNNCYFGINEGNNLYVMGRRGVYNNLQMIRWGTAASSHACIRAEEEYNLFSNIFMDGNSDAGSHYGIYNTLGADHNTYSNIVITGCASHGLYLRGDNITLDNVINLDTLSTSSLTRSTLNGIGEESANAETPQLNWKVGSIVQFTDSGDASGDGLYIKDLSGTWVKID